MWSNTRLAGCMSSNSVVGTTTQLVSITPGYNVPPPVTRQVTGVWQLTLAAHELGAVVMTWPALSKMHGMLLLATAVPCTVTLYCAPAGQVTNAQPRKLVVPHAGITTELGTVTAVVSSPQST